MPLESFIQDLRVGGRVLVREKGFCALAVIVLALGICAVATQFAVVDGVRLRGLAFPRPAELVDVQLCDPTNLWYGNYVSRITTADFSELKAAQTSYQAFVASYTASANLTHDGVAEHFQGAYVTHDFFRVLGVAPVLGRDFLPEDDRPGVASAILLSDEVWQRDFGGNPGVIGRTVRVNGRAGTIVGVMPPKFKFPANEEIWMPLNTEAPPKPRRDRSIPAVEVIGRLKAGVTLAQADAEMAALARRFAAQYPEDKLYSFGRVRPLIAAFGGQFARLVFPMLAFCGGVLLIACVNVMNMQFARATLRAKELAVRSSLGATRLRLVRQMLTESLLLALLGALLGVGLAYWTTDWLDATVHQLLNPLPSWMVFRVDGRVLAFVVGSTLLAAVASGLLPAWLASRANAGDALKESGRGNTGRVAGVVTRGLVVFQLVVTSILLISSLLWAQSIVRQQHLDFGYDTAGRLSARLTLMEADYPTPAARIAFYEKLLRELRAGPGIANAALSNRYLMVASGDGPIELEGQSGPARPNANYENVSDGYFATTGQRLLAGRDFTADDNDLRQPVAIVNATFARKHFGPASPLGRRFRPVGGNGTLPDPWRTIVGEVTDVRMRNPFDDKGDNAGYYVPFDAVVYGDGPAALNGPRVATLLVRPRGEVRAETFGLALRQLVGRVDPNLPLYAVATPQANLEGYIGRQRVLALMFTVFGAVAVVLASAGLYGVLSFSVNQRTHEFGIRMALGADHRLILRMVFRQVAGLLAVGLGLGLVLAVGFATYAADSLANFLFEIGPRDSATYAAVAVLLTLVALVAALVPARRATRVDPMIALRAE